MARTNIDVIITVKDGASKPLDNVTKKIRNTGKAAKDVSFDIMQLGKTIFATTAFLGLFTKGFSLLSSSIQFGSDLDKVTTQFERQMGPRGNFINILRDSSNVVVDEMTALQSGLQLGTLGVAKSSEDAATMVSKFAVVARLAGKDSTEGVEKLTQAVIDGNVAHLEEYGILRRSSPAYMMLMAAMNKAGGAYGGVISKQATLAIIMGAINERVKNQMFSFMSLGALVEYTGKAFITLKQHIGNLLGNAVRPLLEKIIPLIQSFSELVYYIGKNDKNLLFLTKTFLGLGMAVTGLLGGLGSLKLVVKLLGFAGIGFPGITLAVFALTSAFVGLTNAAKDPLEKLKIFGAFFRGIYELVSNFNKETGASKMSQQLKEYLDTRGILGIVEFISATIVTIKTTLTDIVDFVKYLGRGVDTIVGGIFTGINKTLNKIMPAWSTWWTTDALNPVQKFARAAAVILGGLLAFFGAKSLFGGILSKIPVIGKLFGGGGSNPKGTASDPIYTKSADGLGGGLLTSGMSKLPGMETLYTILKNSYTLGGWKQILKDIPTAFGTIFPKLAKILLIGISPIRTIFSSLGGLLLRIPTIIMSIAPLLGPALAGVITGLVIAAGSSIINNILDSKQGETEEGFKGNPLERLFFNMFADEKTKEQFRKNKELFPDTSRIGNKQTQISVPTAPADDEAILQVLMDKMKIMSDADRTKTQSTLESALATQASNGRTIDPEEFKILEELAKHSKNSSESLTILANKALEARVKQRTNVRELY